MKKWTLRGESYTRSQRERRWVHLRLMGGARYIVGLVTLFTVASLILGKSTTRLISSYAISMGLGLFLAVMVPHLGVKLLFNVENLVIPAVLALLVTFELLKTRIPVDTLRLWGLVIVAVVIATVVALPLIGVGNGLSGKFLLAVNPSRVSPASTHRLERTS